MFSVSFVTYLNFSSILISNTWSLFILTINTWWKFSLLRRFAKFLLSCHFLLGGSTSCSCGLVDQLSTFRKSQILLFLWERNKIPFSVLSIPIKYLPYILRRFAKFLHFFPMIYQSISLDWTSVIYIFSKNSFHKA